jgi:hypothetical protein
MTACAASLCALLAACGGGGGGATENRVASVSAVTADTPPSYDNLATFSLNPAVTPLPVTLGRASAAR